MTQWKQLKGGYETREWSYLVAYALFVIFVIILIYWGIRATYFAAYPSSTSKEATNSFSATATTSISPSIAPVPVTATTTNYAPQQIGNNSSGNLQVQGGDITVITKPEPEPDTRYILKTPSELGMDGKYHARIEVQIAFAKQGVLEISPKLKCEDPDDKVTAPVSRPGDVNYYVGLIWRMNCSSPEPIVENAGYFFFRNREE